MSCLNCDNCTRVEQEIPTCYSGNLTISDGLSIETTYIVQIKKYNGSIREIEKADNGAGSMVFSLAQLMGETELAWLQAGTYKIKLLTLNRELQQMTEPGGVATAECLVVKFIDVDQANNDNMSFAYA